MVCWMQHNVRSTGTLSGISNYKYGYTIATCLSFSTPMTKPHPLLSQVPLIVSPSIRPPQAVTLPFEYKSLPANMPQAVNEDDILDTLGQLSQKLEQLEQDHRAAVATYQSWRENVDQQTREEQRKIAPGYLDSVDRILVPQKRTETVEQEQEMDTEEDGKEEEPVNELDKAFGKVGLE
ncbi:YALI0F09427p [Yarrowia lipolytica CLIB122]|uniref:YALI0F09427p n=2 Tax=Yarrowia lipolytica TaxID=4952 RepID=Q6C2A5_YARLI|nr:YALI0F09427p [Yarrowia lipolytica CLIB122]KAJ8055911.1 hypothetical protein LXG23DRAFT_19022 [Yarrowia lipolytica]CAG78014.1 YALI0F09427p [Yarrowia lipolytica CLIB122]|eukprot:XP_505207.1 YALI0F09427p [Yarrowia lipolytica CLIB122]